MADYINIVFLLTLVHFVCDYPLQSDAVARGKNLNEFNGSLYGVPWVYWMIGHASMHGLGVYLVTSSTALAFLETVLHFVIDTQKCKKRLNIHTDQLLHLITKLSIAGLAMMQ